MKIGIIGLPQVGKKTLFQLLTNHILSDKDLVSTKPVKAVCEIRDPRFDSLAAIYKPARRVRARIDIELFHKLEKDTIQKGEISSDINELDAICHVVRAFKDETVYHADGSVDPLRDIRSVNSELILNDMIFVEKRLERIEKTAKQKEEDAVREGQLLAKLKSHLDKELPLRLLDLSAEEKRAISSYPLVTRKAMIIVLNVSEDEVKDAGLVEGLRKELETSNVRIMQTCVKAEQEIAGLESEEEKEEFLKADGIEEPAMDALTRICIKALDLVSFFTVKSDEVRQWTVRAGSTAPEAAGAIHSDLQRGFIRAEVIKYSDMAALGSEEKVKESGRLHVKGKDYIVEDGDIISIRFNV